MREAARKALLDALSTARLKAADENKGLQRAEEALAKAQEEYDRRQARAAKLRADVEDLTAELGPNLPPQVPGGRP